MLLNAGAFAQSSTSIKTDKPMMILTGAVYDINGAVIVNGMRIVASDTVGGAYEATTNDEGIYKIELPLGIYRIKVSAPGFCPSRVERFIVVNSTYGKMSLDFVLEVQGEQEGCKHGITIKDKPHRKGKKQKPGLILE
ncbi:MAG: carboxypeptidase-like regulatory domain-containing protein [Acidobacteria bacterium]|nr:carboxypeptidase-like regulatory domain-containing protein [Acidobacteriota bacterium]